MICYGRLRQEDVDYVFRRHVQDVQQIIGDSLSNRSIKNLFHFAQLCQSSRLDALQKIAVIKCLKGFTEKSTNLAYQTVFELLLCEESV